MTNKGVHICTHLTSHSTLEPKCSFLVGLQKGFPPLSFNLGGFKPQIEARFGCDALILNVVVCYLVYVLVDINRCGH